MSFISILKGFVPDLKHYVIIAGIDLMVSTVEFVRLNGIDLLSSNDVVEM